MDYYNLARIIKNVVYNFMRMFKYLCYSLIAICFIVLCLLLMSSHSNAETITYNSSHYFEWFRSSNNTTYRVSCNVDFYGVPTGSGSTKYWTFYDMETNEPVPVNLYANGSIYTSGFQRWENVVNSVISNQFPSGNDTYVSSAGNVIMYIDSSKTSFFFPELIEPTFLNAEDSHWGNTLTTGEFNYFFIDGNSYENIIFTVIDFTLGSWDNYNNIDNYTQTFEFSHDSDFIYDVPNNRYAVSKHSLKFGYTNGHSYKFSITWLENGGTDGKNWDITTDFSQSAIIADEENQKNNMEKNLNEINGFLNDNTYDSNNITNNMPNSDEYESPTDSGFNNIFTSFMNAFTNNQTQVVRFEFPNSNGQYIEIRSDLVTSKIPFPILMLIQSFYWFVICRYIIKDIAHTAEKAKSGEILDDTSDGNIKTDLL